MNLHPKTLRRVLILIAGAGLICAAGAGVYFVRQQQIARKYQAYRDAGLAAFGGGDYAAALQQLKQYIGRHRDDRDALFAYATSRSRVEEPSGKHLGEGVKAFQMLRELEPDSPRVDEALLELYAKAHYNTEAVELADKVLAKNADHAGALRAKAVALEQLRKFDDAVATAEQLNRVAPTNLDGQLLTYRLYQRIEKPKDQVVARAEALRAAHPEDPRFEMLLAIAYGDAGDGKRGRELLKQAAARTPPDAQFVGRLAALLDSNRMFAESRALLERAAGSSQKPDPQVLAILAQRLWQNGQAPDAAERLKSIDPANPSADSRLLALRALALFDTGKRDDAQPLVNALANRTNDGVAVAWATALSTRFAEPQLPSRDAIARYQSALTRDPDNGVIRYLVGEAYERLGESEPALAAWRAAAALVPSWAKPYEKMARALAATGRTGEAVQLAFIGHQTAPQQPSAAITYAVVAYQHMGSSTEPAKVDGLLQLVESIQKSQPGEPETLPIRAALLARKGQRDAATKAMRDALGGAKRPPAMTLLRLAAVSRAEKLGVEGELLAAADQSGEPLTPALALARASEMAAAGNAAAGMALLEGAAGKATTPDKRAAAHWMLAVAQFREQTRDPEAAAEWVAVGDAYPDDAAVQTAILRFAGSARHNRPFIGRTIDRVKQLTGEEGTLWKVERARWLLGSDREKDHSDAVSSLGDLVRALPTLVEPRLLLASALERVDNTSGAIKELRVAADLEPRSAAIGLELARLLQSEGKFDDAAVYLERVAKLDSLDAATTRHVAAMFAQQGAANRAIELLRAAAAREALDPSGELLLAELLRKQGRMEDAEAVFSKLLSRPGVSADLIQSAADFRMQRGNAGAARELLKRLDDPSIPAAVRELALAGFEERHGTPDAATQHYAAATKASASDPAVWRERITYLLRSGRPADAIAAADEGLAAIPGDATIHGLKVYGSTAAKAAKGETDRQPLIDDLSRDPANARSVATNQLLQDEAAGHLSPAEAAARFAQLADRYPRHKPLQIEAVRRYVATGEMSKAAELAARAMNAFPGEADVAQVATSVYRQAGQWKLMEAAATTWRERSLEKPQDANVAIADARLAGGDPAGAANHLEPFVADAKADPDRAAALIVTYTRALAAGGRDAQARAVLEPLLGNSPRWRAAWMSVAGNDVKDAGAAASWLDHVATVLPSDAAGEQLALAGAWHALATRTRDARAQASARRLLQSLAERPEAPAEVFLLLASASETAGDGAAAEANYRKALAAKPDVPAALNNLAYLLLTRDGDAAEALTLASKAVAASPRNASFHDTLARAQLKTGDTPAALRSFERALAISPSSLEAMIGRATVLSGMGDRERLRSQLQQIDAALATHPPLSPELRRELDAARAGASVAVDPR